MQVAISSADGEAFFGNRAITFVNHNKVLKEKILSSAQTVLLKDDSGGLKRWNKFHGIMRHSIKLLKKWAEVYFISTIR
jgi:hypothetical protein